VLVTYDRDGRPFRASGLHVRHDVGLTADHCADGSQYTVWRSGRGHPATVVWRSHTTDVDLAVLRAEGLPPVRTMPMARLDRTHAEFLDGCTCLCFPAFKRPDLGPGGRGAGPAAGDDPVAQLVGGIPLAEGLRARHGAGAGTVGDGNAVLLVDSGRSVLPRAEDAPELVNTA